ncbi:MAG TPA: RNA-binding domain-containing protein [Methanosarcina thermophila]|nr:RNA-binding domain-containing protein [Methanosarcina thermophila]HPZ20668.1 RNA-binding domain-containing protein [Methanosarcina thermophila]HQD95330.1 RNA-binding domain-containing protein [Methanosarcina thermophila]
MIRVKVSAAVYPTEDPEKVIKAISSLFNDIKLRKEVINTTGSETEASPSFFFSAEGGIEILQTLHGLIHREEIIDSVRNKAFIEGLSSDRLSVRFLLNKQAAFVGVPSIPAQEEPLGSIEIIIRADSQEEMERLFEWLLPPTEEGKPVVEVEMDYVQRDWGA